MKILVTGAAGFIGSRLVNALDDKEYKVSCLVRKTSNCSAIEGLPNVSITRGDIKDKKSILSALKGCNSVVHLAAATSEKASELKIGEEVNIGGSKKLIEACEELNVKRIIVISTQSTKRSKQGAYAKTKSSADKLFLDSSLNITILKPALVYGPGSKGLFVKIQKLATSLPIIPIIGSGEYKMQPTHIDDLNQAIIACLENNKTANSIYDIAGGTRLSFNEFINIVCEECLGKKKRKVKVPFLLTYAGLSFLSFFIKNPPVTKDNVLGLVQETDIDLSHAERDFNYSPRGFREGFRESLKIETKPGEKRVGVVGLGKMGIVHASLINQIPDAKLVAIMDVKPKLKRYAHSIGITAPFFTNLDVMLKEAKPDIIFICVPPLFNKSAIETCVKKGVSVFCEKPLSESLKSAGQIVKTVEKARIKNGVGYMMAHSPTFQRAKFLLLAGEIGQIEKFEVKSLVSQVFGNQKGWRTTKKISGGGCVVAHGSHLIYFLNSFLGKANKVSATLSSPYSKEVEDKADIDICYGNKKGKIFISWSEPGHQTWDSELKFYGRNGTLKVTNNQIILKKGKKENTIHKSDLKDDSSFNIGGDGYYLQDSTFISSIDGQKSKYVTMREGLEVQKVIDAIYRSSRLNKEVKL